MIEDLIETGQYKEALRYLNDLENEKVNQAANTLMYNGLISLTNSKLSMAKSVITGR